jgi:hypothetical protein
LDQPYQGFFGGEFSPLGNKKWASKSNRGILENFFKNSPYLKKKKLEVARFRQCVPPLGCQKISTSPIGQ